MLAFLFQHRCSLSAKCACTSLPRDSSFPPSCCLCPAAEQPRVLTNERPLVFALVLVFVCLWFTLASALAQSHRARNVGVRARRHDARDARPTSGASRGSVPAGSLVAVMHIERRGVHVLASVPQVCLGCSSERLLRCVLLVVASNPYATQRISAHPPPRIGLLQVVLASSFVASLSVSGLFCERQYAGLEVVSPATARGVAARAPYSSGSLVRSWRRASW